MMSNKNKLRSKGVKIVQPMVVVQTTKKNNKKKNKSSKQLRNRSLPREISDAAKLLMDPCNGPLVRSVGHFTPGQVTERFRITKEPYSPSANGYGYIVWFPSFHGKFGSASNNNLYLYSAVDAATAPVNSTTVPMGSSATGGIFVTDPANASIAAATSSFVRAKTISACIQAEFIASLSSIAGQVAVVQNYSLAAFNQNQGTAGAVFQPPNVEQVFAYAAERRRTSIDGHEVVWRPHTGTSIMRTDGNENSGTAVAAGANITDACFWTGTTGSSVTEMVCTNPADVLGICIAWRGLPLSTVGNFAFNCVKVVDLELAARNSQIESLMTPQSTVAASTTVEMLTDVLDTLAPGWQSRSVAMGSHAVGAVATALGGPIVGSATNYLLGNVWSGDTSNHPIGKKGNLRITR